MYTREMLIGLPPEERVVALEQVLNHVYKAIMYEHGKDQGEALNQGMQIIEAVLPDLRDKL